MQELWNCFPDVFKTEHLNIKVGEFTISLKAVFLQIVKCFAPQMKDKILSLCSNILFMLNK